MSGGTATSPASGGGAGSISSELKTTARTASTATVADYLVAVGPPLEALLGSVSRTRLDSVARTLPIGMTECFGFEYPLGTGSADADLLVAVRRAQAQTLLEVFPAGPVAELASTWLEPGGELARKITNLWLEFDLRAAAGARAVDGANPAPAPNAFFGAEVRPEDELGWFFESALLLLREAPLPKQQKQALRMCIERLPAQACVFQTGCMLARPRAGTRLCIHDITAEQIPPYLESVGWTDRDGRLAGLLDELAPLVDAVDLDIDVDECVGPKAGLELYFNPRGHPRHGARLDALLARLAGLGVCTDEERAALLGYPGADVDPQADDRPWPEPLRAITRLTEGRMVSALRRAVHHIKVVHEPGLPITAKAYLEVLLTWVSPPPARKLREGPSQ